MRRRSFFLYLVLVLFFIPGLLFCRGQLESSPIFASGMVLQRGQVNPVWGTSRPDSTVEVEFNGETYSANSDSQGHWKVMLNPLEAGGPYVMEIQSARSKLEYDDILIGDVWICSGQSNMHWTINQYSTPKKWKAEADLFPEIRMITFKRWGDKDPQRNMELEHSWLKCSSRTVGTFSAVAYHFGKNINREIGVPIGLISSNLGGSRNECWVDCNYLSDNPKTQSVCSDFNKEYSIASSASLQVRPAQLYNTMIAPMVGYGMKGVIWYQGESNIHKPVQYRSILSLMVKNWKEAWGMESLPFYYVQIAPFNYGADRNFNSFRLMESQSILESLIPDSAMAVISDIGEWDNIHPVNKHDVGYRLAAAALAKTYKLNIPFQGPHYISAVQEGDALRVLFANSKGLELKSEKGFQLAGEDGIFYTAWAEVENDTLLVRSADVALPLYIRYGWSDQFPLELYNSDGFPASVFRNDSFDK